jgi:putative DNA primase/helicase
MSTVSAIAQAIEDAKPTTAGASIITLANVQPQPIQWLWRPHFALGKLSVLAGHPGLGKSLVTMDLAAHVSTGRKWIDGSPCPKGSVVLVSGEDDPGDTLRPRLDAAGADVQRVHYLRAVYDLEGERGFTLADVPSLAGLLARLNDCRLIIIDPVSAYLAGIDSHKNADVRALLAPLAQMAGAFGVAIICVSHLNKSQGDAIGRVTGSLAFVAAARSAYAVARDKEDPQRRLLLPIKNNLGADVSGVSYRISETIVDGLGGVPFVTWDRDPVTTSADEALAPSTSSESTVADATEFLTEMLQAGSVPVKELKTEATAAGITWRTIERAKSGMDIVAERQGTHGRGGGFWIWRFKAANEKSANPASTIGGLNENGAAMRLSGGSDSFTPPTLGVADLNTSGDAHGAADRDSIDV